MNDDDLMYMNDDFSCTNYKFSSSLAWMWQLRGCVIFWQSNRKAPYPPPLQQRM